MPYPRSRSARVPQLAPESKCTRRSRALWATFSVTGATLLESKSVAMCGDVGSVSLSDLRALEKGRPDDLSRVSSRFYLPPPLGLPAASAPAPPARRHSKARRVAATPGMTHVRRRGHDDPKTLQVALDDVGRRQRGPTCRDRLHASSGTGKSSLGDSVAASAPGTRGSNLHRGPGWSGAPDNHLLPPARSLETSARGSPARPLCAAHVANPRATWGSALPAQVPKKGSRNRAKRPLHNPSVMRILP